MIKIRILHFISASVYNSTQIHIWNQLWQWRVHFIQGERTQTVKSNLATRDRKNVINFNLMGFSVQGRFGIYPWIIIMIISWPPLASLTSNLSSPIFLRKFSTNPKFVKKNLKVQKWAGGHFSSRKSQGIQIFCQISQKITAQCSKMYFFSLFWWLSNAIFWQKKRIFSTLEPK